MSGNLQEAGTLGAELPETFEARAVPRITVQAFCDTPEVCTALEQAATDRRMGRAHVKVHTGGINAAGEFYQSAPTPNLVVIESRLPAPELLAGLDRLAEVCDAGTKVMVIGHSNDVRFYRDLLKRGVSEYLVAPADAMQVIASISSIYHDENAGKLGQSYAFIGAKGGVGSSTIAHNVAWTMARTFGADIVLGDMDLAFGTAGLNFNLDPAQGMAEAVFGADRLDEVLLDRLLAKCGDHLSLLSAPATLDRSYDLEDTAFDRVLDLVQGSVPSVVLDVPHVWTAWARKTLLSVDQVVVTAIPDLANLRNAKNLVDLLKQGRPNDAPPRLVLNQVGVPKRPEIKPQDFAAALHLELTAVIPFDPALFGAAANNGEMIAENHGKSELHTHFLEIAQLITGRKELKRARKGGFSLNSLVGRFSTKSKK
nr:CtpF protein [Faunimonas pinastri]